MKKQTVSIGISAFNEEENIKQLLQSLVTQKNDNFFLSEIIVISDGSTDKTVKPARSLRNPKIRVIDGHKRIGQSLRWNEIISLMSPKSNCLLLIEADTLPRNNSYIHNLITSIPQDGKFSVIAGDSLPLKANNFFEKVLDTGFYLKHEIFEKAISWPNLYLFKPGLLSKEFLSNFKWDPSFHDDSYCFRKAITSGLPLLRSKESVVNFKLVNNLTDYLLQSGKFHKAMEKESEKSQIYHPKMNHLKVLPILVKSFISKPFYIVIYVLLATISKINTPFLPEYSPFWKIYRSSKKLC